MLLRVHAGAPVLYNGARRNYRKPLSLSRLLYLPNAIHSLPQLARAIIFSILGVENISRTLRQKFRWQEHRGAPQHENAKEGAAAHLRIV